MTISCNILEGFLKYTYTHRTAVPVSLSAGSQFTTDGCNGERLMKRVFAEAWAGLQKQTRSDEGPRESQQLEAIITSRIEGTELLRSLKVQFYADFPFCLR